MPVKPPLQKSSASDEGQLEIHLKLEVDYDVFMTELKEDFLDAFAIVADCSREEIDVVQWQRGCVCVNIKLPRAQAEKLLRLYLQSLESENSEDPEVIKLKAFVKKYSVEELIQHHYHHIGVVVKESPKERALLFIHGWSGSQDTFGKLPEYLSEACGCNAYIYKYPTGAWIHSPSIVFIANEFRNWLLNECPNMQFGVLAHSLGGLLLRQFLVSESREKARLDLSVKFACFLASPHNGAALAGIGSYIPTLRTQQMGDLSPQSPILFQLNRDWLKWAEEHVPRDCRIDSIFGTDDSVVSPSNAIGLSEEVVSVLGRTHIDIVKPRSREDIVVKTLLRFLAWSDFAPNNLRRNPPPLGPSVICK